MNQKDNNVWIRNKTKVVELMFNNETCPTMKKTDRRICTWDMDLVRITWVNAWYRYLSHDWRPDIEVVQFQIRCPSHWAGLTEKRFVVRRAPQNRRTPSWSPWEQAFPWLWLTYCSPSSIDQICDLLPLHLRRMNSLALPPNREHHASSRGFDAEYEFENDIRSRSTASLRARWLR